MPSSQMITVRMPNGAIPNYEVLYVGGINVLDLIRTAQTTSTGTGTTATSDTVSVSISQELYVAKEAGSGYAAEDILRRVEITIGTAGTSAVAWYNVSRETKLTTNPSGLNLRQAGDGLALAEKLQSTPLVIKDDPTSPTALAIGTIDDAVTAQDGSASTSLVSGIRRVIANLYTLIQKTPDVGQKTNNASSPVVISTEQQAILTGGNDRLDLLKTALEDIKSRLPPILSGEATKSMLVTVANQAASSGTGGSSSPSSITSLDDFIVSVDNGVDFKLGDQLKRVVVFSTLTTPATASVYWYNITQNKGVAAPDNTKIQVRSTKYISQDQKVYFRVEKIQEGSVINLSTLETLVGGKIISVQIYQETGLGQILGEGTNGWDIPGGGSYNLSENAAGMSCVLDPEIKLKSVSGVMRAGIAFKKTPGVVYHSGLSGSVGQDGNGSALVF